MAVVANLWDSGAICVVISPSKLVTAGGHEE